MKEAHEELSSRAAEYRAIRKILELDLIKRDLGLIEQGQFSDKKLLDSRRLDHSVRFLSQIVSTDNSFSPHQRRIADKILLRWEFEGCVDYGTAREFLTSTGFIQQVSETSSNISRTN